MGYAQDIMKATGCTEREVNDVEEAMRMITGGVLSNLTKRRFNATARLAYETYQAMQAEEVT